MEQVPIYFVSGLVIHYYHFIMGASHAHRFKGDVPN